MAGKPPERQEDFDRELGQVMREERRRGRKPVDEDMVALQRQFERDFSRLVQEGDERKFKAFLNAHGLRDGQERFRNAMSKYRDYQRQRRQP